MVVETEGIVPYDTGRGEVLLLGAKNRAAITRMAEHIRKKISSGEEIPLSPFCEWAADRVTGQDRQDLVIFLQGRRGSGNDRGFLTCSLIARKSYTALYWGERIAKAIARRKGGDWTKYFNIDHCATLESTDAILNLLRKTEYHMVVCIDDASISIGNRQWNSPENKNWNALLSVCRTRRWVLILTSPLKRHVDNQTRDMVDITATVAFSNHLQGWNAVKVTRSSLGASGKEYSTRLSFGGKKVNYFISLMPDRKLLYEYDSRRDSQVQAINDRIVETGSYKPVKQKGPSVAERNREKWLKDIGDELRVEVKQNPKPNVSALCAKYNTSFVVMKGLLATIEKEGNNGNS